jgi:hypothetical protein
MSLPGGESLAETTSVLGDSSWNGTSLTAALS